MPFDSIKYEDLYKLIYIKKKINIAGKMKLNEWKGKRTIEFMIEDISLN